MISQEFWQELSTQQDIDALDCLKFALEELSKQGEIVFLTAFGPEGCVITEMLSKLKQEGLLKKNFSIANLDTGYQFKETLELKKELENKYGLTIQMIEPSLSVEEQEKKYQSKLYQSDPDQCCYIRKLVPLANLLQGKLAWITSIRREQTIIRANAKQFEFDKKFKLGKINPLVSWSKSDVWKYIHENQIPYNPLLDEGYSSIGCEPCTAPGEGRKGRWAGRDKIECGLHIQDEEQEQGGEFVI